jgi:serine/threonine protein kinase
MNQADRQIMSILGEAVEHSSPEERAAFLDEACAGSPERRARIEALLRAYEAAGNFLQGKPAAPEVAATTEDPITERPGTVIGPYKLMEQIGEGGMGLVFVAEQQQPVRRKVALKVIKPGMDTRQVVARFEAERQALALMDHPNIAKVHDGGETASGRPYFVMELVKGVPITEYCDHNQVPICERLELFGHVCQAVQHAHQKGIIHRDIKPSNVLVMSHDGTPLVKVIDFGVAKAVGQQLTDKTIYTQFTQLVGTPLYMSPEQAGHSGLDVDTRSDIYSLGVLLYELLTGTTPFDAERLREVGFDEMRRIIREEEPPKPSTRISTLGQAATTVSTNRKSEPKRLSQLFRGELDWIVMKALEKDRNRRYETANGLARDIERHLHDEPVQACPPSKWYRLRKAARRNKAALAMASVVLVALLLGMVGLAIANYRITQERNLAQREHELAEANLQKARMAVEDYLTTVSENTLLKSSLPGLQPLRKELLQTALRYYQGFVRDHQDDPALRFELAAATFRVGVITAEIDSHEKGLYYLVQARDLLQEMADANPSRTDYQRELGRCMIRIGYVTSFSRTEEAIASFKQGIDLLEAITPDHLLQSDLAFGHHYLVPELAKLGRWDEARQHSRRAIALRQELADRNPSEPRYRSDLALSISNLANIQLYENRLDEALQTAQKAETIEQALVREYPWDPPQRRTLALSIGTQGIILGRLGRKTESLARFREASQIMHKVSVENPSDIDLQGQAARRFAQYAQMLVDENYLEPAEQALARAQEHAEVVAKENPRDSTSLSTVSSIHRNRGKILSKKGKPAEALSELREAVKIEERLAPEWNMMRYDLACSLSLCSAMAARIGARAEADDYAQRALLELRRAWEHGWKEIRQMERDPDLDALRSRSDFQQFLRSLPKTTGKPGR